MLSKLAKKVLIGIAGTVVLLVGIIMIFLPGPAILIIPAGLAILATEFAWAQRLLHQMRERIKAWREKRKRSKSETAPR